MALLGAPDVSRVSALHEHVYGSPGNYQSISRVHSEHGGVVFTHASTPQNVDSRQEGDLSAPPYFTHAMLTCKFKDHIYKGSGALIGPRHLLTCGYHVYNAGAWAKEITVVPASNGEETPFGTFKVVKAYTFTEWNEQKDPRYDIALLILSESVGAYTGWSGLLSTPDELLSGEEVNITGYPKEGTQMWNTKHTIQKIESERFQYSNDKQTSQRGSAISFSRWKSSMIVGVQTAGKDHVYFGARLSKQKVEALAQKIAENFQIYPPIAFGKAEWAQHFGDVGEEPPLPLNINEILNAPCPIWEGKKVYETHLFTLIPQNVNGQPLTLRSLGELVQKPLLGPATKYSRIELFTYSDQPTSASHWALLSRDVIPGSWNQTYSTQQKLVKKHPGCEAPNILDATVSIFMEHVRKGMRLYSDEPLTYTVCQEKGFLNSPLVVGGFALDGLSVVFIAYSDREHRGVGVQRKFS